MRITFINKQKRIAGKTPSSCLIKSMIIQQQKEKMEHSDDLLAKKEFSDKINLIKSDISVPRKGMSDLEKKISYARAELKADILNSEKRLAASRSGLKSDISDRKQEIAGTTEGVIFIINKYTQILIDLLTIYYKEKAEDLKTQ